MCNFCHAPDHAYEVLLEATQLNRHGLCAEASERLRMAEADEPSFQDPCTEYAWNDVSHTWVTWRMWGHCASCGAVTWKYANEPCAQECRACLRSFTETAQQLHTHETRIGYTKEELSGILQGHARHATPPVPMNHLVYSNYSVPSTAMFTSIPGARRATPRPRVLFGHAVLPVRAQERIEKRKAREHAAREGA